MFDTRAFVDRYAKPEEEAELLERIGVFLGESVLGPDILKALHDGIHHRSLVVRQPAAPEDDLAAAFARVPWEIARPAAGQPALFERNLGVRMELSDASPDHAARPSGEPLRVLLVYAEAPGSPPLAMRLEREQLLDLADALFQGGRPDAAIPLYELAVAKAEGAGHWSHVGTICQNWANALRDVGQLDDAKSTLLRSVGAKTRAGSPRELILSSELEVLRLDVMQDGAEQALPEIESRLQEVRDWRRQCAGEPVADTPDPVFLARALISGLNLAGQANLALARWEACLSIVTEIEKIQRELSEGEHELARTRFNRNGPLLQLGQLDEAQRVLENCLGVFRGADDLPREAKALGALADLWDKRGDREQAADLQRQALAVCNRLSDLADQSISHGNLANFLGRLGEVEEAARHRLAQLAYDLVMDHGQFLAIGRRNLAILMSHAAVLGGRYELPRLTDLLARPEFEPIQRTLTERNVGLDELQARIDEIVEVCGSGWRRVPKGLRRKARGFNPWTWQPPPSPESRRDAGIPLRIADGPPSS
ncbi:MAG: tetratricopeptide repeat protein [Acidobacteriota bacterium]